MMREIFATVSMTLAAACAMAQSSQPAQAAPAQVPDNDAEIHYAGAGVVAPELLPFDFPFTPPAKCKKMSGKVKVFIAVDAQGKPRQVYLLDALANDLDLMAEHVAELSTFKPGSVDGALATVGVADEIEMQACSVDEKENDGRKLTHILLRSAPTQRIDLAKRPEPPPQVPQVRDPKNDHSSLPTGIYHVGSGVSAPHLLKTVDPQYTDQARLNKISGTCLISIIVDEHGIPQNPHVMTHLGYGLDESAIWTVLHFRFTPAMKDGKRPVAVMITVEINFRLY